MKSTSHLNVTKSLLTASVQRQAALLRCELCDGTFQVDSCGGLSKYLEPGTRGARLLRGFEGRIYRRVRAYRLYILDSLTGIPWAVRYLANTGEIAPLYCLFIDKTFQVPECLEKK